MPVIVYHNPKCSKSRQTLELLNRQGIKPTIIEYLKTPANKTALRDLLAKLGLAAHEVLRAKENEYAECDLSAESSEAKILAAIVANPILLERPIIVKGNRAVIGRPPENVLALL